MGYVVRYIYPDEKTGRLSYRRPFPSHLRPYVPGQRRQVKRSLKSRTLTDPEAQRLLREAMAEYDRDIVHAIKAAAGIFDPLDDPTIAYLAEAFRVEAMENDEAARWDTVERDLYVSIAAQEGVQGQFDDNPRLRWSLKRREELEASIAHSRALLGAGDLEGILELLAWEAEQFALARGKRVDTSQPEFATLCHRLCDASLAAAEANLARLDGERIETPAEPSRPSAPASPALVVPSTRSASLDMIAEEVLTSRVNPVGIRYAQTLRTALRFWRETYGDVPWDGITRRMVTYWLELLSQRPVRVSKSLDALPFKKLLALYAGDEEVSRLSPTTLRQHVTSLHNVWKRGVQRGIIEAQDNPFSGHGISAPKKPGGNPLTLNELHTVFSLQVFTEGERPIRGRGEASYWIPLFSLFTGSRPEEVAQLLVSDFWQDDDRRWMMRYTDEGEHPALGPRKLKTSRQGHGSRNFPVPQALLNLGLPAYLAWLKASDEVAMFPKLTMINGKGIYEGWGRWWRMYVRGASAIAGDKRPLRELRHNFPTAARESGLTDDEIGYLQGRKNKRMTSQYGSLEPWGEKMAQVRFKGLNLDKVKPWTAPD